MAFDNRPRYPGNDPDLVESLAKQMTHPPEAVYAIPASATLSVQTEVKTPESSFKISEAEQTAVEKIPEQLRRISLVINGQPADLFAFGESKIKYLLSPLNEGSEGGVIFYRDRQTGQEYTLKFFKGSVGGGRVEALKHLEESKRYGRSQVESDDLDQLARGFPIQRYIGQLGEQCFEPIVGQGLIQTDNNFAVESTNDNARLRQALLERAGSVPYTVMPYLKFARASKPGQIDEFNEISSIDMPDHQYLRESQAQLAPEFRGKTATEIYQLAREKLHLICQSIEQKYSIALIDIEAAINLQTGEIKILDTGVSVPLEDPPLDFQNQLSQLYGLDADEMQQLVKKNKQSWRLNQYRKTSPKPS
jgi:hypothetical protein